MTTRAYQPGFRSRETGRRSVGTASLPWIVGFAALLLLLVQSPATPKAPGSSLPLISLPLALLGTAFMLRPRAELPVHALIYAAIRVAVVKPDERLFLAVLAVLHIAQTAIFLRMLSDLFYDRFGEPAMAAVWAITVILLCAAGSAVNVAAAQAIAPSAASYWPEIVRTPATALRHLWLAYACSYLCVAGPIAILVLLRARFAQTVLRDRKQRRAFGAMAIALLLTALLAFPVVDVSWMHMPADVRLALCLLPAPIALTMASRFRVNGASVAALILTAVISTSVGGTNSASNWQGLPVAATPAQTLLLILTTTCMVVAGISRQLQRALNEANDASEAKSRFIAMMNHELRTPLTAILGFTELMRIRNLRELGDAVGPIDNIHASGQRLLAMIEGILSQADKGAGVFEVNRQRLNLGEALAAAVEEAEPELRRRGADIRLNAVGSLEVDADPRALKQIIGVLLSHPLRFAGAHTTVSIVARQAGTDTVVDLVSTGLTDASWDDEDRIELQLVNALALAHGARLATIENSRTGRAVRLTFFATHSAN